MLNHNTLFLSLLDVLKEALMIGTGVLTPCVDGLVVNPIGQRNQDEEDDEPGQHPYSSHESAMAGAQRRA